MYELPSIVIGSAQEAFDIRFQEKEAIMLQTSATTEAERLRMLSFRMHYRPLITQFEASVSAAFEHFRSELGFPEATVRGYGPIAPAKGSFPMLTYTRHDESYVQVNHDSSLVLLLESGKLGVWATIGGEDKSFVALWPADFIDMIVKDEEEIAKSALQVRAYIGKFKELLQPAHL